MLDKILLEPIKAPSNLFPKLMHGLTGSIFNSDDAGEKIELNDTRGVGKRIEKLYKLLWRPPRYTTTRGIKKFIKIFTSIPPKSLPFIYLSTY